MEPTDIPVGILIGIILCVLFRMILPDENIVPLQIARYEKACSANKGVETINTSKNTVTCINKSTFKYTDLYHSAQYNRFGDLLEPEYDILKQ